MRTTAERRVVCGLALALVCLCVPIAGGQDWIDQIVKPLRKRPEGGEGGRPNAQLIGDARTLKVRRHNLCEFQSDLDGQSQGMLVASDGNLYFAGSTRSRRQGAVLFRYLPAQAKLEKLCDDLTAVCGHPLERNMLQSVVSCVPVQMGDSIWFTTTSESAAPGRFVGSHVVGYNIVTKEWRDLGIVDRGRVIHGALAADVPNNRLYVTVSPQEGEDSKPSHLYRIDLPEGKARPVGQIAYGGPIGYPSIWVDGAGSCWVSAPAGTMLRYDPASDTMEGWLDRLPPVRERSGVTAHDATVQARRRWWWVRQAPDVNHCLFTLKGGNALYTFSPGRMTAAPGGAFRLVQRDMGATGLACGLSPDDVLYCVQRDAVARHPKESLLHLKSFGTLEFSQPIADHGILVDKDRRLPEVIDALAVDGKQRVYMVGVWQVSEDETASLRDEKGKYEPGDTALCLAVVTILPVEERR